MFKKFGKHSAIEQFGVMFISLSMCMVILLGSIFYRKIQLDKASMVSKAVYTNSFSFSKTGTEGNVVNVYSDKDNKKVMLLLKMSSMSDISINASDYELYLTGSDKDLYQQSLKSSPKGMLYLFGNSGYMGVFLNNAETFPSQILSLTIRCNNNFSSLEEGSAQFEDESFARYNQARIYFNAGGSDTEKVQFLDSAFTPEEAYTQMIANYKEKNIRTTLRDDLINMHKNMMKINEYSDRLKKLGVNVTLPAQVDGDEIKAYDPETKDELEWYKEESAFKRGNKLYKYDSVWLYLVSDYVTPGGYNFVWQDKKIADGGYMKDLTGSEDPKEWSKYFTKMESVAPSDNLEVKYSYSDGREFKVEDDTTDAFSADQKEEILSYTELLETTIADYTKFKNQYHTDMGKLLYLETDIANVQNDYTINESKNVLTKY